MKISANEFWELLPVAREHLKNFFTANGCTADLAPRFSNPTGMRSRGSERRWIIQSNNPSGWRFDPFTMVVGMLTGQFVDVSNYKAGCKLIGLDMRFVCRVEKAIYQDTGFSRPIRRKLLKALNLNIQQYLEPTILQ
jgi:hypothetical protein